MSHGIAPRAALLDGDGDVRAVKGKTTKDCPRCGKNRIRNYHVIGPLPKGKVDPILKEMHPRVSSKPFWKYIGLAWLVSPPNPPKDGEYYEVHVFATCTNKACIDCGSERIPDREGYRQFGRLSIWKMRLRARLHWGIDLVIPL